MEKDKIMLSKLDEKYPYLIRIEYDEIVSMVKIENYCALILQVKDMFEIILKIPILVSIFLLEKTNMLDTEILKDLIGTPPSLGTWYTIGNKIIKKQLALSSIKPILEDVIRIYDKYKIVKWRNDAIGHGALGLVDSKEFKNKLNEKILVLEEHFVKCKDNYITFPEIESTPYITIENNELFIFDKFLGVNSDFLYLNYHTGEKKEYSYPDMRFKYENIINNAILSSKEGDSLVSDEIYNSEVDKTIARLLDNHDFIKPMHLVNWVNECIEKHDKGVFMLSMERGMGKTTFVKALDEQGYSKIKIDCWVRSYYINDTYLYRITNFVDKVNSLFAEDDNGIKRVNGNIKYFDVNNIDKKRALADILNFYQDEMKKPQFSEKSKLLFIIDGLDEIPNLEPITILDYIPTRELLNDGVYILLTTRFFQNNNSETFISKKIDSIIVDEKKCVVKDAQDNLNFIKKYLNKHIDIKDTKFIDELCLIADNRIMYIPFMKRNHEFIKKGVLNETGYKKQCLSIKLYLQALEKSYGKKYYSMIKNLLCILATAYEPLSIYEINYLIGNDDITYKLLYYFIDIRMFITVERSDDSRGNIYHIQQKEVKETIIELYNIDIENLIKSWIIKVELPQNVKDIEINEMNDYLEKKKIRQVKVAYLFTYIHKYINDYFGNSYIFTDNVYENIMDIIMITSDKYMLYRKLQFCDYIIEMYSKKHISKEIEARILSYAFWEKCILSEWNESYMVYKYNAERAIATLEQYLEEHDKYEKDLYGYYLDYKFNLFKYMIINESTLDSTDYGIDLANKYYNKKDRTLMDCLNIIHIYSYISDVQIGLEKISYYNDTALKWYNDIKIYFNANHMNNVCSLELLHYDLLIRKYNIESSFKQEDNLRCYIDEAISIAITEKDDERLGQANFMLGKYYYNLKKYTESIEYLGIAINIYESIRQKDLFHKELFTETLILRAYCYIILDKPDYKELANKDYDDAIRIKSTFSEREHITFDSKMLKKLEKLIKQRSGK